MIRSLPYQQRPAVLYKHYDGSDRPLYYGISYDNKERQKAHRSTGLWVQLSVRCEIEEYATWTAAEAAEREAIKADIPVFNRRYAPGWQQREFDYLIEIGRGDLVSQGLVWAVKPPEEVLAAAGRSDLVDEVRWARSRQR